MSITTITVVSCMIRRTLPLGWGDALDVLPPEIECDGDGQSRGCGVHGQMKPKVREHQKFVYDPYQKLPGRDAADGTGEYVVEH
jgi:hypothetical protein